MLSYQHGYHAGNFADVHKHTALCLLLAHFGADPKLVTYIDSHSGRGFYDLSCEQAQKTGEWQDGIGRLRQTAPHSPALLAYLEQVASFENPIYPGSPALTAKIMAANHRGLLFELHPEEFSHLSEHLGQDKRLRLIQKNAMEDLIDYLPARNATGLLLVDPSYEIKEEFSTIARLVNQVHKRWPGGTKMVWYPILPEGRHNDLKHALKNADFYELIGPQKERGMYGTGLALINTPADFSTAFQQAETEMKEILFRA